MNLEKSNKRVRTQPELKVQLCEQIHLLQHYCIEFDKGDWAMAKPISVALRVLFHQSGKSYPNQGALLHQLKIRNGFWFDSTRLFGTTIPCRRTNFQNWWNEEIFHHHNFGALCRRIIVATMADQDGGAHVDGSINNSYDSILNGSYFNVTFGENKIPPQGVERACIRTIAHETLMTLEKRFPALFETTYSWIETGSIV
jgi:hypothetical protein